MTPKTKIRLLSVETKKENPFIHFCLNFVSPLGVGFERRWQHVQNSKRPLKWNILVLLVAQRPIAGLGRHRQINYGLGHGHLFASADVDWPSPQRQRMRILTRRSHFGLVLMGHAGHLMGSLHRYIHTCYALWRIDVETNALPLQELSWGSCVISTHRQGLFLPPEPMDHGLEAWLTLVMEAKRPPSQMTDSSVSGISWNRRWIHQPLLRAMKKWSAALSHLPVAFLPSGKLLLKHLTA